MPGPVLPVGGRGLRLWPARLSGEDLQMSDQGQSEFFRVRAATGPFPCLAPSTVPASKGLSTSVGEGGQGVILCKPSLNLLEGFGATANREPFVKEEIPSSGPEELPLERRARQSPSFCY